MLNFCLFVGDWGGNGVHRLVTFASPAIGNDGFCRMLNTYARPAGGLRIWNEYDVVPSIAQLVGFKHAGVPIELEVRDSYDSLRVDLLFSVTDHKRAVIFLTAGFPICQGPF